MRRQTRRQGRGRLPVAPGSGAAAAALTWAGGALALLLAGAAAAAPGALGARLDRALDDPRLAGARIAALVVDAATGEVLYARHPALALIPASNQKILTAVAALHHFGPAHRFETRLLTDRGPDPAGRVGTLFVEAGGDPALTAEEFFRLASDLHVRGVRRVEGGLVIDTSVFDRVYWLPDWQPVGPRAYHAPVAGFTVNYGAFAVRVEPGASAGQPARVAVDPPIPFFRLVGRVLTAAPGSRPAVSVDRIPTPTGIELRLGGRIPAGAEPERVFRSVTDPVAYAAAVLRFELAGLGIEVVGPTREGRIPAGARPILAFDGPPLRTEVERLLKYSNNQIAEALLKHLGRGEGPGNTEAGLRALREILGELGIPLEGVVLADGSGLSRRNRVPPRTLVAALRVARASFAFGPEFRAALPIGGTDGTLERRAVHAGWRLRAKTGLLDGVTALAGYARASEGEERVFAVLVNGSEGAEAAARAAVDDFAAELVTGPEPPAARGSSVPGAP